MTLNEFVERLKVENNIMFETKDIIDAVVDEARKIQKDDYACLTDDEVKNIVLNYKGKTKEDNKKDDKVEVKDDSKKQNEQVALF